MRLSDFDYALPEELIAQHPAAERAQSRLLHLDGSGALHDRRFLDRVATRIVELDRGRLTSFPGNFAAYQERKARMLEVCLGTA